MRHLTVFVLAAAVVFGVFAWSNVSADDSAVNAEISGKLDRVISGQKEVIAAINSLKEDIRIIKVRVTQSQ